MGSALVQTKLRGQVIKKVLYAGTKSEHEGLVLITPQGEFKLQRKGGNPFWDESLAGLEGKVIEAEGQVRQSRFIMQACKIEDVDPLG